MKYKVDKINILGREVDNNTRCAHYHSQLDVIAIKFSCCNQYYACYYCHLEAADHPDRVWGKSAFDTKAIICGVCLKEMTIAEYKAGNYYCPYCAAPFNPKCINHDHFYFEV